MYRVYKMFTAIFPDAQGDVSQPGNNSYQLYLVLLNSKSSDFYHICWLKRITCENWYNVSHTSWYTCVCIYPVTAGAIYYLTTDQDQQDQPTTPQRSFSSAQFSIYRSKNLLKRLLATPATPTHTVHLAITLYVACAGIFCTLHHILLYETLTFPSHFSFFLCFWYIWSECTHLSRCSYISFCITLSTTSATAAFEVRALLSSSDWLWRPNRLGEDEIKPLCFVRCLLCALRYDWRSTNSFIWKEAKPRGKS